MRLNKLSKLKDYRRKCDFWQNLKKMRDCKMLMDLNDISAVCNVILIRKNNSYYIREQTN